MTNRMRLIGGIAVAALLAGCAVPRGTALQTDIVKEAKKEDASFEVVSVDRAALAKVGAWPMTGQGIGFSWPGKGQSQVSRGLRSGDKVNLTIWDSQVNSLIASDGQRVVPVQGITVTPAGTIFVPYIEEVKVAGLTPEAARGEIQTRLASIAPTAQVQLDVVQGDRNMIDVVSGVARPGRYPVGTNGVTILSILAEAGGVPTGLRNPIVRLQRGGRAYAILSSDLMRDPAKDIMMRGGDRITVEPDPRSFVVLGAAGAEQNVLFTKASHTLLEALALSSGIQESRANIKGVLVLRKYSAKAVRKDGKGPPKPEMVFTFDLSTGDGLFAARSFKVHPDDVILATESPLPATATVIGMVGSLLSVTQRFDSF